MLTRQRRKWQKALVLVTNNMGQNQALAEELIKQFTQVWFHQWKVFTVAPTAYKNATYSFVLKEDFVNKREILSQETLKQLNEEFKAFNYEIDSLIDLSSDVSEESEQPSEPLDMKSEGIFDEYDRLKS